MKEMVVQYGFVTDLRKPNFFLFLWDQRWT